MEAEFSYIQSQLLTSEQVPINHRKGNWPVFDKHVDSAIATLSFESLGIYTTYIATYITRKNIFHHICDTIV